MTNVRSELENRLENAALSAAAVLIGGLLGMFGLALLCATAVVGRQPVLPALWLRMLLMFVLYMLIGSALSALFLVNLRGKLGGVPRGRPCAACTRAVASSTRVSACGTPYTLISKYMV